MEAILLSPPPLRSFLVVFQRGDETVAGLLELAKSHQLCSARFSGVGAFSTATLAFFDWEKKEYERIAIRAQVEVVSLIGNVTLYEGAPRLHAHVTVSGPDGSARGGHLLEGFVRPTLEVTMEELPLAVRRTLDPEARIPLIDAQASRQP